MTKMKAMIGSATLAGLLAVAAAAQTPMPPTKTVAPVKTEKKAKATVVKSDAEIQADIQKRLAAAPKLKAENISATVAGGVATFTGTVKNSGSKGGVSSLARAAGAKSVVNNITIEKPLKPAKAAAPAKQ
ncbi:MAG: BON domain-containing protein [Acidobacteria bacterium]|nr:BON domain-containing protein [Acidobacteriota bacterium]